MSLRWLAYCLYVLACALLLVAGFLFGLHYGALLMEDMVG